jgi:hypothetical protein
MSVVARGKLDDGIENTLWWLIRIWEMSLQSFINTGRRKESQDRVVREQKVVLFSKCEPMLLYSQLRHL